MIRPIAILAGLAGLGFALYALLVDGTGVNGTVGAGLAVLGSSAALIGLFILLGVRLPTWAYGLLAFLTVLAAGLTAVAGWVLMQDGVTISMAIACIAMLVVVVRPRPLSRN